MTADSQADRRRKPANRPDRGPFGFQRWQLNQYVVGFLILISFFAFDASTPFFPLYIRDLGDLLNASIYLAALAIVLLCWRSEASARV